MRTMRAIICGAVVVSIATGAAEAQQHFVCASGTGNNATIAVPASINPNIDGVPMATGDEIAVYTTDGICAGATVWQVGQNAAITVWGDDDQTEQKDGMSTVNGGEIMKFRMWRKATNTEITQTTVTYSRGEGRYKIDSLYVLASLQGTPTGIHDAHGGILPRRALLRQNYPNPFNPATRISFYLPRAGRVALHIFDLHGRRLSTLRDEHYPAGNHTASFRAAGLPSGTYFYELRTGDGVRLRKKMILAK